MKFFKAFKKLYNYLTEEETPVVYDSTQEPKEPEIQTPPISQEEEIEVEAKLENPYVDQVRNWAIKKIDLLHEADRHRNAKALAAEFDEWINIPEGVEEIDYLCLEDEEWTDDQEIDVR